MVHRLALVVAASFVLSIAACGPGHARPIDANGNTVCSRSGLCVHVAASAQATLQCVVSHIEAAGVRVKALGGYRGGHCSLRHMHPCGKALDVNQTARDVNGPPRHISDAAARACGAVSGSWWANNPDNGHFQVGGYAGTHEGTRTYAARSRHHRHNHYAVAASAAAPDVAIGVH